MFFEGHHSTERNYFCLTTSKNTAPFPLHIHRAYECYAVTEGTAVAVINGVEYSLTAGEAVLVFPYQRHEYKTVSGVCTWVCIFSPDIVGSFNKGGHTVPTNNKFRFAPEGGTEPGSLLLKKAVCYKICGCFDENAEYNEELSGEEDLLSKILIYISKNYTSDCSLEQLARHVGYDYSYVSKFFKRMIGITFKTYLNGLRVSEACRLLASTDMTAQSIGEKCGFNSTRTFNREFLRITGKTPREYVKSGAES